MRFFCCWNAAVWHPNSELMQEDSISGRRIWFELIWFVFVYCLTFFSYWINLSAKKIQMNSHKNTSSKHVVYNFFFLLLFWHSKQYLYTSCHELVFLGNSMNNLSSYSYCGLTDSRMRASALWEQIH